MSVNYDQLIIRAPFTLIKGFTHGFAANAKPGFSFFFNRKSGIKQETFGEHLLEYLNIDQYTHLIIDHDHIDEYIESLERIKHFGIELVEHTQIHSAEFHLDIKVFNEEFAHACKELILSKDSSLILSHPNALEHVHSSHSSRVHRYSYHLNTQVSGPFDAVMKFYLSFKKSNFQEFVECSPIELKVFEMESNKAIPS